MSRTFFIASFSSASDLLDTVREARRRGWTIHDAYVPFPVHGLDEAMGIKPSRLGWACFLFGAPALVAALSFQSWVAAIDWPINIGGKPFFFWQMFVPVGFEFTVLCAGLGTVATLLVGQRLLPGRRPSVPDLGATNDRFVLVLVKTNTAFDEEEVLSVCRRYRVVETRDFLENAP
ncbi:MAG: DUF3341 domain-containing protein [Elusimicrobia bacterium]|nr:DUF3341 domain-containing protein [Elusimicrobiota bacterium]